MKASNSLKIQVEMLNLIKNLKKKDGLIPITIVHHDDP
jgi:hypothetical protein